VAQGEEKTEYPTELKLKQARQKGQVARSTDITTLVSMSLTLLFLLWFAPEILKKIIINFRYLYLFDYNNINQQNILYNLNLSGHLWFMLSVPILAVAALASLIANLGQIGFLLTAHPLKPALNKLDPIRGFKKIFSRDRAIELLKQLIKFSAIFYIIYRALKQALHQVILLLRVEPLMALISMKDLLVNIIIKIILCFLVIAVFDWFWQRYSFIKSMRMSKYEIKKEYKQQEGDPHIKQERRRMHEEIQEGAGIKNVSEAAVVITNPSHVAVAIKYKDGVDQAPTLIAKGVGKHAKELIYEAQILHIPIMRNVPLARDLQWLSINEEIPEEFYDSVAEVLIFIHELNAQHEVSA
jgi:flagellar biosynthesis protein FlhB